MKQIYLKGLPALVPFLLGYLLLGLPSGPDILFPLHKQLGAFFYLLWFIFCLSEWGYSIQKAFDCHAEQLHFRLPVGLAFAALFITFLGALGFTHYRHGPWLVFILFIGPLLSSKRTFQLPPLPKFSPYSTAYFLLAILLFSSTWQLQPHWDPFWYHLTSARMWAEAGKIYFPMQEAMIFHTGIWDHLYLWPQILLGSEGNGGLIAAQFFSQWLHLAAFFSCAPLLYSIFKKFTPFADWANLATIAALLSAPLFFTSLLAKNDWGASLWFFSGLIILLSPLNASRSILAGVFLGLALGAKWTILLTLLPAVVLFVFLWKLRPNFFYLFLGFTGGLLPILLRNYLGTGNPFYPLAASTFSTPLPTAWITAFAAIKGNGSSFPGLLLECIAIAPLLPIALAIGIWKRKEREVQALLGIVILSFVGLFLSGGENTLLRWLGPGLGFLSASGILLFPQLFYFSWIKIHERKFQPVFLFAILYLAQLPLAFHFLPDPALQIRFMPGGQAQADLRLNHAGKKIAVLNDSRLYYLSGLDYTRVWDSIPLEKKIGKLVSLSDWLRALQREGFELILESSETIDRYHDAAMKEKIDIAIAQNPASLLFHDASGRVVEIDRLLKDLEASQAAER